MSVREIRIYKSIVKSALFAAILIASFARCANIAMPQGGPKDSIPPKIVAMDPAYGITNFTGNRFTMEFDEYVVLKDQQKEFYTSPMMEKNPTLSLRGKTVRVDWEGQLDSNRTYSFNFGLSVQDNNEGNPYAGLRYVFSTGPHIDSLLMSGFSVDAMTMDTAGSVFLYFFEAIEDLDPGYDSTMFLKKPDVIGRSMPNGIFIAENLKPMPYRIYGFEDKNGNMGYEPGTDRVAFLDSVYNPARMPEFDMWYDTVRNYIVADAQVMLRLFSDEAFMRQNLTASSRPLKNKVILEFLGTYPQIDTLIFRGIDSSKVFTEYMTPKKDSIAYWFDVPEEELPDTLMLRLAYQQHDSTNTLIQHGEDIRLVWRTPPQSRQQARRQQQEEEAEEDAPNPFKVSVKADRELIPYKKIELDFEYPLRRLDSAAIVMKKLPGAATTSRPVPSSRQAAAASAAAAEQIPEEGVEVKFRLEQDSLNVRKWSISTDWKAGEKYSLMIPAGAFENIMSQQNDTLTSEFTIASPDKFATFVFNVQGKDSAAKYIIQFIGQAKNIIGERAGISTGNHTVEYIPTGRITIRIVEDLNGNGVWDPGSLIERRQPERVAVYIPGGNNDEIDAKEKWRMEYDLDMNEIFRPLDMEYIRDWISFLEAKRRRWREEEQLKNQRTQRNAQTSGANANEEQTIGARTNNGNRTGGNSPLGGSSMGGAMPFGGR